MSKWNDYTKEKISTLEKDKSHYPKCEKAKVNYLNLFHKSSTETLFHTEKFSDKNIFSQP